MESETAQRYLRVILRWWWLLVLGAVIPAGISYRLASQEPDVYQAKATIIVGQVVFENPNPDRRELDLSNTLAAAYSELLTQRSVLEPVIDGLGLQRTPDQLAEQITTRIRSSAQLLEIRVVDLNPEAAAVIANRLADELIRRSPTSEQSRPEEQAFIEGQLAQLEAKIRSTGTQIDELISSLDELTSAAEIRDAEDRIAALEQVESRYQSTYAQLLSVSREGSPNELALFEQALVPSSPVPRRTRLVVALAGAAGLGLALSAVVLMEYLETSFRWDVRGGETVLDMSVLGVVPKVTTKGPVRPEDALSPAAEGVRAIRSKLFLMRPDQFLHSLLLTSPGESEGKSFLVAHLSIALASGGIHVIAVDGDMRRPTLHELFDRPNLRGLADVLGDESEGTTERPAIPLQDTEFDGLHLLSAGPTPVDPAALLTSPRFQWLMDRLTDEADVIVIDSPPVLGSPDATIAATRAEGTILVVSEGLTTREAGRKARDLLLGQDAVNLLGLAVNRAGPDSRYDYYYSYGEPGDGRLPGWWKAMTEKYREKYLEKYLEDGKLTLDEAAARLGISKRQARRWCRTGRVPATKRWLVWWQVEPDGLDGVSQKSLVIQDADTVGETEEDRSEDA